MHLRHPLQNSKELRTNAVFSCVFHTKCVSEERKVTLANWRVAEWPIHSRIMLTFHVAFAVALDLGSLIVFVS